MLNQLKTIETNLRARLSMARILRRIERPSEKSESRQAQNHAHASPSPLPPENVYFIIELA
jgi:hypothetical protein